MAQFDTLIRGGRIVDGSGAPSLVADIAVKDGKVVAVGKALGQATRTLDADGLIAPGRRADINLFDLKRLHAAAPRTTAGRHAASVTACGRLCCHLSAR